MVMAGGQIRPCVQNGDDRFAVPIVVIQTHLHGTAPVTHGPEIVRRKPAGRTQVFGFLGRFLAFHAVLVQLPFAVRPLDHLKATGETLSHLKDDPGPHLTDAHTSAAERVYAALRAAILTRSLLPGQALSRGDLAREHGVSPTPLREALLRLEREGFIAVFPQSRTVVTHIDVAEVHQMHVLRTALECEVVSRLARRRTPPDLGAARATCTGDPPPPEAFSTQDDAFHQVLFEAAGLGLLRSRTASLHGALDRCRALASRSPEDIVRAIAFHKDILARIDARDTDGAAQAMRAHLTDEIAGLATWQKAHPELFAPTA